MIEIIELLGTGSVHIQHTRSKLIVLMKKYKQLLQNEELGIQEPEA